MRLKDQERVKKFLETLHSSGRLPNSFLFYGPAGVGKTTCALEFSKGVLCLKREVWGCGECPSCIHFEHTERKILNEEWEEISVYEEEGGKRSFLYLLGEHPDFIFVPPSGSSLKIDQVRGVKEFVNKRPALSKKKVVLMDNVHKMTKESANALLKVLEEPPEDTHFFLVAQGKENLLPTVLSRTYQVEFSPLDRETFYELLGEENRELYELSGGSVSRARDLKKEDRVFNLVEDLLSGDPKKVYKAVEEAERLEKKEILVYLLEERARKSFLEGRLDYDRFEVVMGRLGEIRNGIDRGIKLSLALVSLRTLWR